MATSKALRIFVSTWNVGENEPVDESNLDIFLRSENEVDVYAVGFQEIKTGAQETVKSFIKYDDWAKRLMAYLSKKGYYMIESVRVQGISLSVFALLKHLPHVRFVKTEIERTGVAGAWGNKGGVAVSTVLYGQKICFLNVHLSAHLNNNEARIGDVNEIYREMDFGGTTTILSHDIVLMFGDMNFRIDDYTREFIIESVEKKNYSVLWDKDQLKKHQKTHKILSQFQEGSLDFDPTYKYDPDTDTYDTSEKKRKPAWTDRVMWSIHPEFRNSNASPFTLSMIDKSFKNHTTVRCSDHKPVTCQFDLKIRDTSFHEPIVRIAPEGNWSCDQDGRIKVELYEGMSWSSRDYVALYKHNLKDFRTYHTYKYVPKAPRNRTDSSSDDSDNSAAEEEEDGQRLIRAADDDPNDSIVHYFTMKKSQISEPGCYRLGYYSTKMSCLIAISDPFEVL